MGFSWISNDDAIVLYAFKEKVEADRNFIDLDELDECIDGSDDEMIDNYEEMDSDTQTVILNRVNALLNVYFGMN